MFAAFDAGSVVVLGDSEFDNEIETDLRVFDVREHEIVKEFRANVVIPD